MGNLLTDLRQAIRVARRAPLQTLVTCVLLAVTMGASFSAFRLYRDLTLSPIPGVADSGRIISLGLTRGQGDWMPMSLAQFRQVESQMTSTDALFALGFPSAREIELPDGASMEFVVEGVSTDFFQRLGIPILVGSDLQSASSDPLARNVILSELFWRSAFAGESSVIGSTISIGQIDYIVTGVAGGGFQGLRRGRNVHAWISLEAQLAQRAAPPNMPDHMRTQYGSRIPSLNILGRLAPGSSVTDAASEFATVINRMKNNWLALTPPSLVTGEALSGAALNPYGLQTQIRTAWLQLIATMLLLLIAAVNLATYFLSRGFARLDEIRIRFTLGASRLAIFRLFLIDGVCIIICSVLLGILLSMWWGGILNYYPEIARNAVIDWRSSLFLIILSLSVATICAFIPAIQLARAPFNARGASTLRQAKTQKFILVFQISITACVVYIALAFTGQILGVKYGNVGFSPSELLVANLRIDSHRPNRTLHIDGGPSIDRHLATRIGSISGVDSVAFASVVPFADRPMVPEVITPLGAAEATEYQVYANSVSEQFFQTLQVEIIRGRIFANQNKGEVVVSQSLAQLLWGNDDAIGKRFISGRSSGDFGSSLPTSDKGSAILTVVGLVRDIWYSENDKTPLMFYRYISNERGHSSILVRGPALPGTVLPVLKEFVGEHLPGSSMLPVVSMSNQIDDSLREVRIRSRIAAGVSLLVLVLTIVSIYSTLQQVINTRAAVFAVHKALGATNSDLGRLIVLPVITLGTAGILLAIAAAGAVRLGGIHLPLSLTPTDLLIWASTSGVIFGCSALAVIAPVRRVMRLNTVSLLND